MKCINAVYITNPHAFKEARRNILAKRQKKISELKKIRKQLKITHAFCSDLGVNLPSQDVPILARAVGSEY